MRKGIILFVSLLMVGYISCTAINETYTLETLVENATQTNAPDLETTFDALETEAVEFQATLVPECSTSTFDLEIYNGKGQWVVARVLDGDSIKVYEDTPENDGTETKIYTVQLVGIDAPELDECGGKQAWEALRLLIAGKHVELYSDMYWFEVSNPIYKYVEFKDKDVGQWMLEKGWASVAPYRFEKRDIYLTNSSNCGINSVCIGHPTPDATVAVSHCIWQLFATCEEMEKAGCAPAYMTDTWYEDRHDHNNDYIACGKGD